MTRVYRIAVLIAATAALAEAIAWYRASQGGWVQSLCASWFVMVWVTSLRLLVPYELPRRVLPHQELGEIRADLQGPRCSLAAQANKAGTDSCAGTVFRVFRPTGLTSDAREGDA